ncbi:ABC transporter substrate-binding protein [Pseudomonas sp. MB-090624]|nr:ABC transporter substrate-binding protein [Pseudomonas sp. MB-090624]
MSYAASPNEIKENGVVVIGCQEDQYPWGFINDKGQPDGHDIEIAKLIAKELGVELQLVRITAQNRIPMLLTHRIDFLVPGMSITPERAKVIQYTLPYSSNEVTVFAPGTSEISGMKDLAGKTVGVARGSIFDTLLTQQAPPNASIRRFDDDASTVQALASGQVEAILGSFTYGLALSTGRSGRFEDKFSVADNYLAMAVRKEDKAMLDWLNKFVQRKKADGELAAIYSKWMKGSLPMLPERMDGIDFGSNRHH